MAQPKYIVWIREPGRHWEPNGEGELTEKQAQRIARETVRDFHIPVRVYPVGQEPI